MQKVYLVVSLGELKKMVAEVEKCSELLYDGVKNDAHTASIYSHTLPTETSNDRMQLSSSHIEISTFLGLKPLYLI
jgi:hypothetical protein